MNAEGVALDRSVRRASSALTFSDRWDHVLARWAYRRESHRVAPGLYSLGEPTDDSPVFVSANYTLSFDALRSALAGVSGYILVLDTFGVNVWCAAGKGTFGTEELVHRIEATGLGEVVSHRRLILPQLGAPGVSAHEVNRRSGFRVEYGPVRADDLPEYLRTRRATPEMRRVRFDFADRLTLVPVEVVSVWLPALVLALLAVFAGLAAIAVPAILAILAGVVLFPVLLPWLPTRDFTTKGYALGLALALLCALGALFGSASGSGLAIATSLSYLLALPPITAYLALNFTGATTFTSRSGVEREMRSYLRPLAVSFAVGVFISAGTIVAQFMAPGVV
jgi:hypothetical protein